ncbi:hypothetical protein HaLaN_26018 [Haematococcus lacustris]|uniref:RWP-RK domain-containing protein n=1 Tax=Haematococcus lacustris TaxID=44745 RepID=A0A6A0A588_HAELA|nr:hypothetical protein HaLaN_26018 [Haematococcus lacustris]
MQRGPNGTMRVTPWAALRWPLARSGLPARSGSNDVTGERDSIRGTAFGVARPLGCFEYKVEPGLTGTQSPTGAAPIMSNKTPLTLDTLRTVRADDGLICYEAFHLPRELAAEQLQVTVNELKKSLKNLGVGRWPYRKIASLQALQHDLDQQIHAFRAFGSADGPAMSHVQDLQGAHFITQICRAGYACQNIARHCQDCGGPECSP